MPTYESKPAEQPVIVRATTGTPWIPTAALPYLAFVFAVIVALKEALPDHTVGDQVAGFLIDLGSFFGILSAGVRKSS